MRVGPRPLGVEGDSHDVWLSSSQQVRERHGVVLEGRHGREEVVGVEPAQVLCCVLSCCTEQSSERALRCVGGNDK